MYHVHNQVPVNPGHGQNPAPTNNPLRLKEKHFISPIVPNPGQQRKRRKCARCLYHTVVNYARNDPVLSTSEELTETESETE